MTPLVVIARAHLQEVAGIVDLLAVGAFDQDLPESEDRLRLEIQFHTAIGVTMMATKGWGAPEVLQAYSAAKILCERLGDPNQLFTVLRGEGQYHMVSGNVRAALELARQCMQLAEHASDPAFFLEAHHLFWATYGGLCHRRVSRE